MLNVGFLEVTSEAGKLSFSLLVEFNLGLCGTTGFLKTLTELLEFTGELSTLLLSLGTSLSLSFQLLFELLDSGLELLDLLLEFGYE